MTVTASITAGLMLLAGAVGLGLRWPSSWFGPGPADSTEFDYSAHAASFGKLSDEYLRSIFGGSFPGTHSASPDGRGARRVRTKAAPVDVTHPFINDDFEGAYEIPSVPFRARTDTIGAKRQSGEPSDCSPVGGTAWYRFRPATDLALFADTFGTPHATSLGIYSGSRIGALNLIGCDTNVLGNAQVGFRARAGDTYYFQVTDTLKGGGGPTVFELAAVGATTLLSATFSGAPPDGTAYDNPDISAEGRYVAFLSKARNLSETIPDCGRTTTCETLYLRDRLIGKSFVVASEDSFGDPNDPSGGLFGPSISADGRYLGFSVVPALAPDAGPGYRGGPTDAEPLAFSAYLFDRVTGRVELVSRNSAGEAARSDRVSNEGSTANPFSGSYLPSVSADGRYVTFNSDGTNLGTSVKRGEKYVYRRDRITGVTRVVSTDSSGEPMRGNSCAGTGRNISGDGRYVAFINRPIPEGGFGDDQYPDGESVYLWDATTGRSRLVSKVPPGTGVRGSYCPSISLDGSRVGLVSLDALVPEDTNETPDVYVYEVATDRIRRISVTSGGQQTHDPNYAGREHGILRRAVNLSADGRFAVFDSAAPDLAPGPVGSTRHPPSTTRVFLHDLETRTTVLVSVSSTGEPLPGDSNMPYISPDGRSVAFMHVDSSGRLEVMVHELSIWR